MTSKRTVPRVDERATADRAVAADLRKSLAAHPERARSFTGRELRELFGRGRLTEKARADIDAALGRAGLVVEPRLVARGDAADVHRVAHPDASAARSPAPAGEPLSFHRPGRGPSGPAASGSSPSFRGPGQASPASVASHATAARAQLAPTPAPAATATPTPAARTDRTTPGPAPTPGPARSRRGRAKWVGWAVAAVLGIGWLSTLGDDDRPAASKAAKADVTTASVSEQDQPAVAEPTVDPRVELVRKARTAAAAGRYADAYALAVDADRADLVRGYQAKGLSRARRRAEAAVSAGRPASALSIVRSARRGYGVPGALAPVAGDARAGLAEIAREKAAAKARAKAAAKARKEARAAAARDAKEAKALAAAAVAAEPEPETSSGADYAGMTCPEIGHSFTVEPGSDPDHDADNDGVACESQ